MSPVRCRRRPCFQNKWKTHDAERPRALKITSLSVSAFHRFTHVAVKHNSARPVCRGLLSASTAYIVSAAETVIYITVVYSWPWHRRRARRADGARLPIASCVSGQSVSQSADIVGALTETRYNANGVDKSKHARTVMSSNEKNWRRRGNGACPQKTRTREVAGWPSTPKSPVFLAQSREIDCTLECVLPGAYNTIQLLVRSRMG